VRNFFRFLLTFWLPLLPLDCYVAAHKETPVTWLLWFFLGFIGFSALTLTVSDVCNGIHPNIGRSYRRLATRRLLFVCLNGLLLALIVAGPPAVPFLAARVMASRAEMFNMLAALICIPSLFVAVFMMYAPVITALEEEITPSAVAQRSWTLGMGYFGRALLALLLGLMIGGVLVLIVSATMHVWPTENTLARLFVSRLLIPWLFTATVLMYYDLRSRKEGYNFPALTEDLWVN
jgi:hypothetical protein